MPLDNLVLAIRAAHEADEVWCGLWWFPPFPQKRGTEGPPQIVSSAGRLATRQLSYDVLQQERSLSRRENWPSEWRNQPSVLYHGTDEASAERILADGVDVHIGRQEVDFGQGFYTTTLLKQAQDWARMRANRVGGRSAVVSLTVDRLALGGLRSLVFARGDLRASDYWSFVAHCRRGRLVSPRTEEDYDVVYGPVAIRWGPDEYEISPGLDQTSFHGDQAQKFLRDASVCKMEVLR